MINAKPITEAQDTEKGKKNQPLIFADVEDQDLAANQRKNANQN
jgi:hypothetical protein